RVLHQLGDDFGDRAEATQVVEGEGDHDAPPVFDVAPSIPRIFATASGTDIADSSLNHARSSVGASSAATWRASAASLGASADWIAMKWPIVFGSSGGNAASASITSVGASLAVVTSSAGAGSFCR